MGTTAPYGYVKDPADHNHLLIDDKVAHVVREIFDLALAGNGIAKIRKHINKQHILRPAAYAAEQGATGYERYFEENEENRYIWSENSVRGILRSPIYAGNLAGYKRIAANMKSKKRPSKLPEEWEVIPDTHEGIVTQEEFDTVQQLITSRRLPENKGGFENIFAGVIKCADCGYAMRAMSANRRKRPDIIDCVQYSCNNYGRYGNIMCTAHSIEARDLFNAVLTDINRFADMAVNDEKAVRAIEKRLTETDQSKAKALEKEQRKLNKRLAELDRLFSSLYEDKVMERITERNFEMMSGKYQKEQLEIEARLKEVTETLSDSYEKTQGVRDFLSLIRNYQGIKELDATIINALIDKILVSEREKLTDGMVRQEIKIYYKFIGFVGELHITPTKRWTALKPKNCTVCGVEYVPRSGISKYCPACAKKIQREKSNESKRRSRERNRQACIELSAKNDRLTLIVCLVSRYLLHGVYKNLNILVGLIFGYILSAIFTVAGIAPMIDFSGISKTISEIGFFSLPRLVFFTGHTPVFDLGAFFTIAIVFLVSAAETTGATTAVCKGSLDRDIKIEELQGSLAVDGFSSTISGCFGCLPLTSFSQNVGLVTMTGVINRFTILMGALILILASLFPPLGAFFNSLPQSVLGGCTVMMFGSILYEGIKMLKDCEFNDRTMIIVSLAFCVGVGLTQTDANFFSAFPQAVGDIFNGNAVAGVFVVSLLLSLILPKDKSEKVEE